MSVKVMAMVFDRYAAGGGERLLALALADFASDDGSRIWPTLAELMRRTVQSPSTVHRQIASMLSAGWLQRAPNVAGRDERGECGGSGLGPVYRIDPAWIAGEQGST